MHSPVQTLWLGTELSGLQRLSIRSFGANGHDYHLYSYDPVRNVPEGVTVCDAAAVLPRDRVFAYQRGFGKGSVSAFSNQFRYALLLKRGGWWVDTDVVCLRPFESSGDFVFATERDSTGEVTAASCVLRAPAGSELMAWCFEETERRDPATLKWGEIGPRLMQAAITRFGMEKHYVTPDIFNPVDYAAFDEIVAAGFDMSRLDGSWAVHLWNQMWMAHHRDPDFAGPTDSLYSVLRQRYPDFTIPASNPQRELERHAQFLHEKVARLVAERDETQNTLEMEQQLRVEAEQMRDAARTDLVRAQGEVEALRNSLSWRLMAPVRRVYDLVNGASRARDRRRQE